MTPTPISGNVIVGLDPEQMADVEVGDTESPVVAHTPDPENYHALAVDPRLANLAPAGPRNARSVMIPRSTDDGASLAYKDGSSYKRVINIDVELGGPRNLDLNRVTQEIAARSKSARAKFPENRRMAAYAGWHAVAQQVANNRQEIREAAPAYMHERPQPQENATVDYDQTAAMAQPPGMQQNGAAPRPIGAPLGPYAQAEPARMQPASNAAFARPQNLMTALRQGYQQQPAYPPPQPIARRSVVFQFEGAGQFTGTYDAVAVCDDAFVLVYDPVHTQTFVPEQPPQPDPYAEGPPPPPVTFAVMIDGDNIVYAVHSTNLVYDIGPMRHMVLFIVGARELPV